MEPTIHSYKIALRAALIVILILAGLLVYTTYEVNKYQTISSGTYFTATQCEAKYGFSSLIPITNDTNG